MNKVFLTTDEAVEALGMGKDAVLALCRSGYKGFPAIRTERKYLINATLLIDWAARITNDVDDQFMKRIKDGVQ